MRLMFMETKKIKQKVEDLKVKAELLKDDADLYIRKNPYKAMAIAGSIGAVLGALISKVCYRRK